MLQKNLINFFFGENEEKLIIYVSRSIINGKFHLKIKLIYRQHQFIVNHKIYVELVRIQFFLKIYMFKQSETENICYGKRIHKEQNQRQFSNIFFWFTINA